MRKVLLAVAAAGALLVAPVGMMAVGMMAILSAASGQASGPCAVPLNSGAWTQPTIDADGVIGSPFGQRYHPILKIWRMHNGVDIGNVRGTPIWAVSDGVVTAANDGCAEGEGSCNGGAGNFIAIDHGSNTTTKYLHLHPGTITVRVGDRVTAGQQIAAMGSTGLSTAPHLHFGVQVAGAYIDPDTFMRQQGVNVVATTSPTAALPVGLVVASVDGAPVNTGAPGTTPASLTSRTTTGVSITLDQQQLEGAGKLIGAGQRLGVSQRGIQIVLMAGLQESTLGSNPATWTPNADQDVGTLQQRSLVGWYGPKLTQAENVAWLNDPSNAGTVFFQGQIVSAEAHAAAKAAGTTPAGPVGYRVPGLLTVSGWETMTLAQAAQTVQRSAYPDAYAKWEPVAADVMAAVQGIMPGGGCGAGGAVYPPGDIPQSDRPVGSEANLTPATIVVKRAVAALFPEITMIGGWRASSAIASSDHPFGRAIDVMIPTYGSAAGIALGDRVADFVIANHQTLRIKYVIWRQRSWSPQNPTWRPMADRGSDVANHYDHVHISVED